MQGLIWKVLMNEVQCFLCLEVINEVNAGDLHGKIVCLASDECDERMKKLYIIYS